jgi:hypothetical protein
MDLYKITIKFVTSLTITAFMQQGIAAQFNKCVDRNGKITFTQMGCSSSQSKKRITVEPSPNSMDRLSGGAVQSLRQTSKQQKTRTISNSRIKKKCTRR